LNASRYKVDEQQTLTPCTWYTSLCAWNSTGSLIGTILFLDPFFFLPAFEPLRFGGCSDTSQSIQKQQRSHQSKGRAPSA
jgi:hypothetical protein